ncbi:MAG: apolipoprotein N-acyltransferase [Myxococcales bacterium]|nr:apolipoprotein N-acyltransferase [Myxococcales bacterium]
MSSTAASGDTAPRDSTPRPLTHPTVRAVLRDRHALALAALSGVAYFLGFASFEVPPFAFVSLAPLLVALRGRQGWAAIKLGWVMGFFAIAGGFYWIAGMLKTFSGFPLPVCILLAALLWAAQGLQFGVMAWVMTRADARDVPRLVSVPLALAAVELAFPVLFPWYTANSLHHVPLLIQTADLGGPIVVSAGLALGHAALAEAATRHGAWPQRLRPLLAPLAFWAFALPYGAWRIAQVDAAARARPSLQVGIVQENLGLMEKRNDPYIALDRHLDTSRRLEAQGAELIVWSESAIAFRIPEGLRNIRDYISAWDLHTPVMFGALSVRGGDDPATRRLYNTAFITDAEGNLRGSYDKVYLLAFGEYIPGGELLPWVYQVSRNSGHFSRGTTLRSMPGPRGAAVLPLICYEDILPRFVRDFRQSADASLMAVILNDAWFGDTAEPWIHNALSKFRAIEHRRDLVRSANSGVSSIIDAAGRVVVQGGTFRREALLGRVTLREGSTPYDLVGDWCGWAGILLAFYGLKPVRQKSEASPAA